MVTVLLTDNWGNTTVVLDYTGHSLKKNQYVSTSSKVQLCKHSGGSRGGARRGPPTPLHLDQTEARRAEKIFFGGPPPPPPSQDLDDWPLPPYWKIWIRHCHWLFVDLISALMKTKPGLTVSSEVSDSQHLAVFDPFTAEMTKAKVQEICQIFLWMINKPITSWKEHHWRGFIWMVIP